jgi:putative heme-binding domain-containing protein
VNGKGARTAPDLSDIGSVRQPAAIQRSLVAPNDAMLPINRTVSIVTNDGRTIRGRRINEDTFTVQLMDSQERLVSLEKSNIRQYDIGKTSDMPSFSGKLSEAEIADIVAYLISLKG